ncbi:MAG: hypothetical protein ND866_14210 [Pyrinomonadaceae bacterium]|nr:hypothetical protein [Pyrinomonadaceae bacterium]
MINKLLNRLRPARELNKAAHWLYLREAFATWRSVALARDTARIAADHDKVLRLCLLSTVAWRRYVRRRQRCIP